MRPKITPKQGQAFSNSSTKNLYLDCIDLLKELATKNGTVVHLRCAARVLRIMQNTNLLDSSVFEYAKIVQSDNKHGRDFAKELDDSGE